MAPSRVATMQEPSGLGAEPQTLVTTALPTGVPPVAQALVVRDEVAHRPSSLGSSRRSPAEGLTRSMKAEHLTGHAALRLFRGDSGSRRRPGRLDRAGRGAVAPVGGLAGAPTRAVPPDLPRPSRPGDHPPGCTPPRCRGRGRRPCRGRATPRRPPTSAPCRVPTPARSIAGGNLGGRDFGHPRDGGWRDFAGPGSRRPR